MWIKICGNTNLEDAHLAVEAGTDALGFVFAPSPRQVTAAQVERITRELPPQLETYGVFVDETWSGILTAIEGCGLTGVQLHHSRNRFQNRAVDHAQDRDLLLRLRRHFAEAGRKLSIVRVFNLPARWDRDPPAIASPPGNGAFDQALDQAVAELTGDAAADALLVDASTAAAVGGTGVSFDWRAAQAGFLRARGQQRRIILAGGLRPGNVKDAIATLQPWGVDVVSGVEAAPGKKDPARLLAFIRAVREAESGIPDAE